MSLINGFKKIVVKMIFFVCLLPSLATGQSLLEEIVVTASKRDEVDLQSIGSTISAFTGESLDKYGFTDFEDYADFTPGFSFQKTGPGKSQFVVRGVSLGRVAEEPQNRSTTGLYLNDVPITQNGLNVDPDLFDMERVEIVKGPQGSLFGDSAMAGAIRYITKQPNTKEFEGRIKVGGSDTEYGGGNYLVKGAVNIPIIEDAMAIRASAYYRDNSGWIDNVTLNDDDINTEETVGGRAQLFWQISDKFNANVLVWIQDMEAKGDPREEERPPKPGIGSLAIARSRGQTYDDEFYFVSGELNYDLGWGNLTSLSSYSTRDFTLDDSAFVEDVFLFSFPVSTILPNNSLLSEWTSDKFTQELRLATTTGGRFDATIGVYYSEGELVYPTFASADGADNFLVNVVGPIIGLPSLAVLESLGCGSDLPDHFFCGQQINDEEQLAVFGELYWNVTNKLKLTVGGRWFDYKQVFDEVYGGFFNGGITDVVITNKEDGFNPKIGISYQPNDDILIYGSGARGFRLGGVNDPVPAATCSAQLAALGLTTAGTFESDSLWSFEGGAKTAWMDGRMVLNGSVYHTVWEDIQTVILLPGSCGFGIIQNASKQEITGTEIELGFQATENLSVNLAISYTDAELSGDAPNISGVDGDRAPYVPKWKLGAFIDYAFPITATIAGNATFSVNHTSNSFDTYNRGIELPERTVGNLRIGAQMDRYTLTAFANNIWNERIVTDAFSRFGENQRSIGQPRTIGVELDVDF